MTDDPEVGGRLRDAVDAVEIPLGPGPGEIRRRVHVRRRRRRVATGAAGVMAMALVVGAITSISGDGAETDLTAAAPPGYEAEPIFPAGGGVGEWEWRSVPRLTTRTGGPAGYGTRAVAGSTDLLVYLADGPVCVDGPSCAVAPEPTGANPLARDYAQRDGGPLASLVGSGAPLADWNVAVVPSVTGDFGAGRNVADVPGGPADQQLRGRQNLQVVLTQLATEGRRQGWDRVVLVGSGTGAIGAILITPLAVDVFGPMLVSVIADGAPIPPAEALLPTCVVQRWAELGGLSFPADYADHVAEPGPNRLSDVYEYLGSRFPDIDYALVASRSDRSLPGLFRAGADACGRPLAAVEPDRLTRGLEDLDRQLDAVGTWDAFLVDGSEPAPIAATPDLGDITEFAAWLERMVRATDP